MKAKGHTPILDNEGTEYERLGIFVEDYDIHNGPGCATCGWSCCMHCNRNMDIPVCKG